MIQDLENIIFKYANVKDFSNKCDLCKKFKHQKMLTLDIIFYQIKLSFILDHLFDSKFKEKSFQQIMNNVEFVKSDDTVMNRYGWVTNSYYIDTFYNREFGTKQSRLDYYTFLNKNFDFIEERNMNICMKCKNDDRKIKID